MKNQKNILIAFILNLTFSVIEIAGGILTGSIAIASDAVHDLGDSLSIGVSYIFERKSRRNPDDKYTYGYARYSVLGGGVTLLVLFLGSIVVIYRAIMRFFHAESIDYSGMMVFAVIGLLVNLLAAIVTSHGKTVGQRAVNLHMLEDVLGWAVVLIGAVVMRFTDWAFLDPAMSIAVAVFILINALKGMKEILDIFLERTPRGINVDEIKRRLCEIEGVDSVHHIHLRSLDGNVNYATMHIVHSGVAAEIKRLVREELSEHGILHATLELEEVGEVCADFCCRLPKAEHACRHHHHH